MVGEIHGGLSQGTETKVETHKKKRIARKKREKEERKESLEREGWGIQSVNVSQKRGDQIKTEE